jgi:hypothetical protein
MQFVQTRWGVVRAPVDLTCRETGTMESSVPRLLSATIQPTVVQIHSVQKLLSMEIMIIRPLRLLQQRRLRRLQMAGEDLDMCVCAMLDTEHGVRRKSVLALMSAPSHTMACLLYTIVPNMRLVQIHLGVLHVCVTQGTLEQGPHVLSITSAL